MGIVPVREAFPVLSRQSLSWPCMQWAAMGGGMFMSKAQAEARDKTGENLRFGLSSSQRSESDIKISEALEKIGNEVGANVTSVALAWLSE